MLSPARCCARPLRASNGSTQRIYEVKADVPEHLPRIEVGKGTEMMGVRMWRMVHAGESDVTLVRTGLPWTVEPARWVYTARFCTRARDSELERI
jgi:hypothetical protein